jgi:hypothetical protein
MEPAYSKNLFTIKVATRIDDFLELRVKLSLLDEPNITEFMEDFITDIYLNLKDPNNCTLDINFLYNEITKDITFMIFETLNDLVITHTFNYDYCYKNQ